MRVGRFCIEHCAFVKLNIFYFIGRPRNHISTGDPKHSRFCSPTLWVPAVGVKIQSLQFCSMEGLVSYVPEMPIIGYFAEATRPRNRSLTGVALTLLSYSNMHILSWRPTWLSPLGKLLAIILTVAFPFSSATGTIQAWPADQGECDRFLRADRIRLPSGNEFFVSDPHRYATDQDISIIVQAIDSVWRKYRGPQRRFEIEITGFFLDRNGREMNFWAGYFPEEGAIKFGIGAFLKYFIVDAPRELKLMHTAAHEAKHMVQHLIQGRTMVASDASPDYENEPIEIDANIEATDYVKGRYPGASGYLQFGDRKFQIPHKSSYRKSPQQNGKGLKSGANLALTSVMLEERKGSGFLIEQQQEGYCGADCIVNGLQGMRVHAGLSPAPNPQSIRYFAESKLGKNIRPPDFANGLQLLASNFMPEVGVLHWINSIPNVDFGQDGSVYFTNRLSRNILSVQTGLTQFLLVAILNADRSISQTHWLTLSEIRGDRIKVIDPSFPVDPIEMQLGQIDLAGSRTVLLISNQNTPFKDRTGKPADLALVSVVTAQTYKKGTIR